MRQHSCAINQDTESSTQKKMRSKVRVVWREFIRALTRSQDPFNPYIWIYRLTSAVLEDIGLDRLRWRPLVPMFALVLIGAISASYFFVFRRTIIETRWCESTSGFQGEDSHFPTCRWMRVHDLTVFYLVLMTTTSFLRALFTSPGIHVSTMSTPKRRFNLSEERALVARFGDFETPYPKPPVNECSNVFVHPCPYPSRCEACEHVRPPRCHHCKICKCCVLLYDHHCFFLNQCIGYNNYRAFFQTILFVTLGSWYGVLILYKPFYEPVQEYLIGHGGLVALIQRSIAYGRMPPDLPIMFALPNLQDFWDTLTEPNHPKLPQTILDAVFPLVFAVGAMMALFLGSHVKYALRATTTLEHKIALDRMFRLLAKRFMDKETPEERWTNPFDQGSFIRNWAQVFGHNSLLLLLPIPVPTPPPFIAFRKDV